MPNLADFWPAREKPATGSDGEMEGRFVQSASLQSVQLFLIFRESGSKVLKINVKVGILPLRGPEPGRLLNARGERAWTTCFQICFYECAGVIALCTQEIYWCDVYMIST